VRGTTGGRARYNKRRESEVQGEEEQPSTAGARQCKRMEREVQEEEEDAAEEALLCCIKGRGRKRVSCGSKPGEKGGRRTPEASTMRHVYV
jgi:hypothetical protein